MMEHFGWLYWADAADGSLRAVDRGANGDSIGFVYPLILKGLRPEVRAELTGEFG